MPRMDFRWDLQSWLLWTQVEFSLLREQDWYLAEEILIVDLEAE